MNIKTVTNWLADNSYDFSFIGDPGVEVSGFASLNTCEAGKITWIKKRENYEKLEDHT